MTTPNPKPTPTPEQQRDALAEAQKKANEKQPRSYDERNETEKQVRINPTDPDSDDAIKGIDPAQ
jgi:hypothetical protein